MVVSKPTMTQLPPSHFFLLLGPASFIIYCLALILSTKLFLIELISQREEGKPANSIHVLVDNARATKDRIDPTHPMMIIV